MTPAEVGRAIAAAMGRPVEAVVETGGSCGPRVHAGRNAVVAVACGMAPEEVGRAVAPVARWGGFRPACPVNVRPERQADVEAHA
jgi:hypothetical protein